MKLDALGRLVWEKRRPPRGLDAGQATVIALPEVSDGLPALVPGANGWGIYSACGAMLEGPVRRAFDAALREAEASVDTPLPEGDELVEALRRLIAAGMAVSSGAGVVPLLETIRQTAALISAPSPELASRVATVRALPADEQGAVLGWFAARVQLRMSLALAQVWKAGTPVPALAQAVAGSRFGVLFERGALDPEASLPLLAAVMGIGVSQPVLAAGTSALRAAITGVLERRNAGRSTPEDLSFLLRHLPPDLAERGAAEVARALITHADAVAWLLPQLAKFSDSKSLVQAGVPAALAKDLLRPEQGLALAAALVDVLQDLRRWEVIAALASSLIPVADAAGRADRALVVPHEPLQAVVVAVGLGRLRHAGVDAALHVDQVWEEALSALPGTLSVDLGFCGLAVFLDPLTAFRFALGIGAQFGADAPAVGVGAGAVTGGTDGDVVRIAGVAVERALQWLSLSPLPPRSGTDHVLAIGLHGGRLCGHGVGIDAGAAEVIEAARHAAGLVSARDATPAGDARTPRSLDTLRVFELDGHVVALVRVAGVSGGYEARSFTRAEWVAVLDRDSAASAAPVAPVAPVQRPVRAGALEQILLPDPEPLELTAMDDILDAVDDAEAVEDADAVAPEPASMPAPPVAAPVELPDVSLAAPSVASPVSSPEPGFDPFLSNEIPERSLMLDVSSDDGFGPARPVAATTAWGADVWAQPAVPAREDVPATDGFGFAEPEIEAPVRLPDVFTDFFLPGAPPPASHEVDIDDDSSVAGPLAPPVAVVPPPTRQRAEPVVEASEMDFYILLRGYCTFLDGAFVVFGRPYGSRIGDRHAYPNQGDVDEPYRLFLQDKIADGFVSRSEMVGDLPRGVTLTPLDPDRLAQAWRALS
jgi:hypothetical protein